MDKSTAAIWRETFTNWPAEFRRKGVVIPTLGEQIPFCDFLVSGDVVIFERATPDNVGARRVCIPFQNLATLKYTEPLKTEQFIKAGFRPGANVPQDTKPKAKKVPIVKKQRPLTPEEQAKLAQEKAEEQRREQLRLAKEKLAQLEQAKKQQELEQQQFAKQKLEQQNIVIAPPPGASPSTPPAPTA